MSARIFTLCVAFAAINRTVECLYFSIGIKCPIEENLSLPLICHHQHAFNLLKGSEMRCRTSPLHAYCRLLRHVDTMRPSRLCQNMKRKGVSREIFPITHRCLESIDCMRRSASKLLEFQVDEMLCVCVSGDRAEIKLIDSAWSFFEEREDDENPIRCLSAELRLFRLHFEISSIRQRKRSGANWTRSQYRLRRVSVCGVKSPKEKKCTISRESIWITLETTSTPRQSSQGENHVWMFPHTQSHVSESWKVFPEFEQ